MDPVLFFSICASLEAVERRHRIGKTQLIQKVAKLWMLTALSCGFVELSPSIVCPIGKVSTAGD